MAEDTKYSPFPYIYLSVGLAARPILDRAPEHSYLDFRNALEREEGSVSSRFGNQIINRDPAGVGTSNYFFSYPVTTLARLAYASNAYRYAQTSDGSLWRRTGNAQGAYSSIYTGLSGNPFGWLVDSCFETSQPYIFFYDSSGSWKDTGVLASPQLTGIDPPPYTANALPYSPLLLMIDSFAETNTYSTGSVSSWGWGAIETLDAASGSIITDFTQFYGISPSGGGTNTYTPSTTLPQFAHRNVQDGSGTAYTAVIDGFTSIVPASGEVVAAIITWNGNVSAATNGSSSVCQLSIQYSPDSGVTWYTLTSVISNYTTAYPSTSDTYAIAFGNLDTVQFRGVVTSTVYQIGAGYDIGGSLNVSVCYISVSNPGAFGPVANGMVSVLNTGTSVNPTVFPISSVVSTNLVSGLYTALLVTTIGAHGLSIGNDIGVYASSNDLVDGFYTVATVPSTTTFTVPFVSAVQISALGGYVTGGATAPPACVLSDQYSSPYPPQMSAWGFYQMVDPGTTSFPIGAWSGTVSVASTTGTVSKTVNLDLNQNNQVTDDDLIILTLLTSAPANIAQVQLQFFTGAGTNNYYTKFISPAYYQQAISATQLAYAATQSQILADALGLITGQPPNTTSAQLQPSNFSTGAGSWQACYMRRGDFLAVGQAGQAGLDWANITGWKLSVSTNTGGSCAFSVNGLYLQWGYGPSSFGGIGYDWRYDYYNASTGTESNGSPIQTFNEDYGYLSSTSAPIFLRQASQVTGQYSSDSQVTHVRQYRRGGSLGSNWFQVGYIPNVTAGGSFQFKDVIADAFIEEAKPLVLDNDPPVTSSLVTPIQTQLAAAPNGPGSSIYSTFAPQMVTVANVSSVFVANQIALVGYPSNLEEVRIITGGTGQFTAVIRLQHNAGEPVICNAIPRVHCNICCLANDGTVYLAGDKNNPQRVYRSKPNNPESFGPQDYTDISSPDDAVMAIVNWRGTIVVGTLKTWYILPGGAARPIPTGAAHGIVAQQGWTLAEGGIVFQAVDGERFFTGADGNYMTLPVEWIFRGNPLCIPPQLYQPDLSGAVMAYYNNCTYLSYVSNSSGTAGPRYRLVYDHVYKRFRYDDVPATAMLWEKDTNAFLVAKQISPGNYAIVQDWVGDYDDGGWVSGALVQTPINLVTQSPYLDLGSPHNQKVWNALETDCNTQGQTMTTTLLFDDLTIPSLTLPTISTAQRTKVQSPVTPAGAQEGSGQQAYRASIQHTIQVTIAPILYQEDIYAQQLAAFRYTLDSYQLEFGTTEHKLVKEALFDVTSTVAVNFSLFAEGSTVPYYTFSLPASPSRDTIRVRFPALKMRMFRIIGNVASGQQGVQFWSEPQIRVKTCREGSSFALYDLVS